MGFDCMSHPNPLIHAVYMAIICLFIDLFIFWFNYFLCFYLFINLFIYIFLYIYLLKIFIYLFIFILYLYIYFIYIYIYLFIYISINIYIYISVYPYMSISLYLYICISKTISYEPVVFNGKHEPEKRHLHGIVFWRLATCDAIGASRCFSWRWFWALGQTNAFGSIDHWVVSAHNEPWRPKKFDRTQNQ
jgi:hypothetical protein